MEVSIEPIFPDHGFFTIEDSALMNITMYNRSSQNMTYIHLTGYQRYLGEPMIDYSTAVEPNRTNFLAPGEHFSLTREMDNRWEGRWQVSVAVEANLTEGTLARGGDFLLYNIYPLSDRFAKETSDATREAALAAQASAEAGQASIIWLAIAAVASPAASIFAIRYQHYADEVRAWNQEYRRHASSIAEELKSWLTGLAFPYAYYQNGELTVRGFDERPLPLLKEAKLHLSHYSDEQRKFDEIAKETDKLTKRVQQLMYTDPDSFENIIRQKIMKDCPTITPILPRLGINVIAAEQYEEPAAFFSIFDQATAYREGRQREKIAVKTSALAGYMEYYYGSRRIAFGTTSTIYQFTKSMTDILADPRIKKITKEYLELHDQQKQLHEEKLPALKDSIGFICDRILRGEEVLRGHGACKGCPPKPRFFSL